MSDSEEKRQYQSGQEALHEKIVLELLNFMHGWDIPFFRLDARGNRVKPDLSIEERFSLLRRKVEGLVADAHRMRQQALDGIRAMERSHELALESANQIIDGLTTTQAGWAYKAGCLAGLLLEFATKYSISEEDKTRAMELITAEPAAPPPAPNPP